MVYDETDPLRSLVAQVAAAYLYGRKLPANEIPSVIEIIASALREVVSSGIRASPGKGKSAGLLTDTQIAASIGEDRIISFEDGHGYRSLKPHLTARGLTPDQYRAKWGLPETYPMVAQSLSRTRSQIAKRSRLGGSTTPNRARRRPD